MKFLFAVGAVVSAASCAGCTIQGLPADGSGGGTPSSGGAAGTSSPQGGDKGQAGGQAMTSAGTGSGGTGAAGTGGGGMPGAGAGAAGTPGVAGAAGTNSVATCKAKKADPTAPLTIDDFETGTDAVPHVGGRYGFWQDYDDQSAGCTLTGVPKITIFGPGYSSSFAAEITGSNCTSFGAGMSVSLNTSSNFAAFCTYDVTAYDGVSFFAKSDQSTLTFVQIEMINIEYFGGTCTQGASQCNDFFGQDVALTPDWKPYTVKFKDLKQRGFGAKFVFDASQVDAIGFNTSAPSTAAKPKFNIAIDDLAFTLSGAGGASASTGGGGTGGA